MPNRFCAICGKSLNENSPYFNMCINCYLIRNPLFELPNTFSLKVCIECGKYCKKEEWLDNQSENYLEIIENAVRHYFLKKESKSNLIDFHFQFDENSFNYDSNGLLKSLTLIVDGKLIESPNISSEQKMEIRITNQLCNNCSNIRSGMYFTSILQLRVKNEDFFHIIADCLSRIENFVETLFFDDNRQYISKLVDQKNGVDLYLSTNELMKKIIVFVKPDYNFILKRTKKLVGRNPQKGKNIYRLKTLLKFLPFIRGDVILLNEKRYYVENLTPKKVFLRSDEGMKIIKDYNYFFDEKLKITLVREEN